ncbi:hypothetical protein Tco_0427396 [Tanacetum coccineum]
MGNDQPLDRDSTFTTPDEGTAKTTPRPEVPGGPDLVLKIEMFELFFFMRMKLKKSPPPQEDIPTSSTAPHTEASDTDSSSDKVLKKYDDTLPLTERKLVKYLRKVSHVLFERITEEQWDKHEEVAVHYANLKASVDDYYNENIAHRDQTDKLVEAFMSSLEKSSSTINDLYKGLTVITELLKNINNAVKDDPAANQKINEATETFAKISSTVTKAQPITTIHPEPIVPQREGKGITTDDQAEVQRKLVKASSIVRPDPDAPVLVPYIINGELHYLTEKQIQEYLDKEERIKKAEEEARLNAISKPEHIRFLAPLPVPSTCTISIRSQMKANLQPKLVEICSKNLMDAEHEVTAKEYGHYRRGTDGRIFDVHKPFLFGAFGISELDKLREIISKKKNTVVQDLMNSLSQRYQRLREIPRELGIQSALPAPKQAPSQTSGRKWKHIELEPETRIPGLECNRALPENVPFVNNMVIKEPE